MRYTVKKKFIVPGNSTLDPGFYTRDVNEEIVRELMSVINFNSDNHVICNGDVEYTIWIDTIVENYNPYIARAIEKAKVEWQNRNGCVW